jgi:hypothetical protein
MEGELKCQMCGRGPAQQFSIRRHVGMILLQKFYKIQGPLCRDHAMALGKKFLGSTALLGWWGVTSFLFNIGAVITDVSVLIRASSMPHPVSNPSSSSASSWG